MTRKDQRRFVREILASAKADIMSKIDRIPEDWDGIEIREWISDLFKNCFTVNVYLTGKRKREYKNELLVRNLA